MNYSNFNLYEENYYNSLIVNSLVATTFVSCYWKKILYFFIHPLGTGFTRTKSYNKKKVLEVKTDIGALNFPILKMFSFDVSLGFFEYPIHDLETNLYDLDFFKSFFNGNLPEMKINKTIDSYWILNERKPTDFRGKTKASLFLYSPLDDIIYLYQVENNQLINYEDMIANYLEKVENDDIVHSSEESVDEEELKEYEEMVKEIEKEEIIKEYEKEEIGEEIKEYEKEEMELKEIIKELEESDIVEVESDGIIRSQK